MQDLTAALANPRGNGAASDRARPLPSMSNLVQELRPLQEAAELPDLFAGLAGSVRGVLNADACLVSLFAPDKDSVRDVGASVIPPARLNTVAEEYPLALFPATRAVLETGHSVEIGIGDPTADVAEREYLLECGFGRVLICRFAVEGEPVGTVEVYRIEDRPFRSDDSRHVDALCSFAANSYARLRLAAKLEMHYTETMEALASALEARDPYTQEHAGRIRDLAVTLAVAMKTSPEERRAVRLGSILHDVGKIGVSDSILLKRGPLNADEWAIMRSHPVIGERMLKGIAFLAPALPIIRHHHERWDGRGYPDGLAEDDIPIGARIVAVCDAFDAMTSDRPYRKAMTVDAACAELLSTAGAHFDPACAKLLVEIVSSMGDDHLEERFVHYAT